MDVRALPKAALHDHLDGGLRVGTVLELADRVGHRLPTSDEAELTAWFDQGTSGSLERYLDAFTHTVAVMQTAEAVARVAYESIIDLAIDNVVYAEVRFDPGLCTRGGLSRHDAIEAALHGMATASGEVPITCGLIVTALRHLDDSTLAAEAALRFRADGVVGFDLAGPERGNPPDRHVAALRMARKAGLGITVHAGEGDGPHSMWRALALCGAQRIGHGARIVEDTDFDGATIGEVGAFASSVRDLRVPLEISVTSNLGTGMFEDAAVHPLGALHRAGFNVSINTDNRLMSSTGMSDEYQLAVDTFGFTTRDLGEITIRAIEAGFGDWTVRRRLIEDVVAPAYAGG